ncbi:hypothetical protein PUNSTDRAFT_143013 [Punctularia strigosozonata HHB-11173 SS5]|uniref:uncharacterized protein n=1 Tax=Punctularia strigosozonata (strain HHB-11173) TaxID=741275 RepID=UPI0004418162|nr:uncharacterized protein PUNSTDRAFT_143013 [Punctularia strigosozonata HHB-11173 SS5]EIN09457.1 hypothetical protein PUNSTDRAFT_143013 [Punctularia strigosozonata HHB-11173 SS5]
MPPQPGLFPVHHSTASSSRAQDEIRKDRKRKEIAGRMGKEILERRDDGRQFTETISALHSNSIQLAARPETHPAYNLRLYPVSLERSALLAQLVFEERHALDCIQTAYDEEREKVEAEFQRGMGSVRTRLMDGIEERRKRAREEKDGDGTIGDTTLDSQARPHITRKLRNKLGNSPPPTPGHAGHGNASAAGVGPPINGPGTNPLSLSVDELPSPFPLPLVSSTAANGAGVNGAAATGRKRAKGEPRNQIADRSKAPQSQITHCKNDEIESDLGDIRRGNKRRRGPLGRA